MSKEDSQVLGRQPRLLREASGGQVVQVAPDRGRLQLDQALRHEALHVPVDDPDRHPEVHRKLALRDRGVAVDLDEDLPDQALVRHGRGCGVDVQFLSVPPSSVARHRLPDLGVCPLHGPELRVSKVQARDGRPPIQFAPRRRAASPVAERLRGPGRSSDSDIPVVMRRCAELAGLAGADALRPNLAPFRPLPTFGTRASPCYRPGGRVEDDAPAPPRRTRP